jgi:hypothetical protein
MVLTLRQTPFAFVFLAPLILSAAGVVLIARDAELRLHMSTGVIVVVFYALAVALWMGVGPLLRLKCFTFGWFLLQALLLIAIGALVGTVGKVNLTDDGMEWPILATTALMLSIYLSTRTCDKCFKIDALVEAIREGEPFQSFIVPVDGKAVPVYGQNMTNLRVCAHCGEGWSQAKWTRDPKKVWDWFLETFRKCKTWQEKIGFAIFVGIFYLLFALIVLILKRCRLAATRLMPSY